MNQTRERSTRNVYAVRNMDTRQVLLFTGLQNAVAYVKSRKRHVIGTLEQVLFGS